MTEGSSNHSSPIRIEDRRRFQDFRVETALLKSDLTIYERMVYVVLCSYASREGECFPSVGTIAESAGCSERQVQRALQRLEDLRVIRKSAVYRPGTSRQLANLYTLVGFRGKGENTPRGEGCLPVTHQLTGGVTGGHRGGDCQSPQVLPEEPEDKEQEKIPDTLYPEADASAKDHRGEGPEPRAEDPQRPRKRDDDTHTLHPGEKPDQEKPEVTREQIPSAFRETYDLFLLKTGRTGITESERARIEALEKLHIPSRVQAEISKSLERFRNPKRPGFHPRDPGELTWHYLWDVLKNQKSGKARQEEKQPAGGRRNDPKWLKQLEVWANGG